MQMLKLFLRASITRWITVPRNLQKLQLFGKFKGGRDLEPLPPGDFASRHVLKSSF